jgi:hypothetical protein
MNDELRAALDKLDAALAEARAALEPEPPCDDLRAAFARIDWALQDARAAMEPEPEPATEPEPPCVELPIYSGRCNITYTRINEFSLCDTDECNVDGVGTWPGGQPTGTDSYRMKGSAFSIWQECQRKRVPCPEPPHIIIVEDAPVGMAGTCRWEVADVKAVSASGRGSGVLATARAIGPFYTTDWQQVSFYTAMSPAAIRAACDEAGVPCPEPPTVVQRMIDACKGGE